MHALPNGGWTILNNISANILIYFNNKDNRIYLNLLNILNDYIYFGSSLVLSLLKVCVNFNSIDKAQAEEM